MHYWIFSVVLLCVSAIGSEPLPPIVGAKTGDWTYYSETVESTLVGFQTFSKFTVRKSLPDKLILESASYRDVKNPDKVTAVSDFEIGKADFDLREYYACNGNITSRNAEWTDNGKGEEELMVAGRKMKTQWIAFHVQEKEKPETALAFKIWFSDEVLITRMVKCVGKHLKNNELNASLIIELRDYGVGK